jgi:hypothetical protein
MSAVVLLGHATHTLERVAVTAQHKLLERADFATVTHPFSLEDTLSQVTNMPMYGTPVDGIPGGMSLGFDCRVLHLSAPRFARFTSFFKRFTCPASALVSSRRAPYPAGYARAVLTVSLCLSAAGLCFSGYPVPAEACASLAVGIPGFRITAGLPRSALVRCNRGGRSLYSGVLVPLTKAEMNPSP